MSVTKAVGVLEASDGLFTVIDVPGTNDPGGTDTVRLTNENIAAMFVDRLNDDFIWDPNQGINSITHCLMPDAGGRIKEQAMQTIGCRRQPRSNRMAACTSNLVVALATT